MPKYQVQYKNNSKTFTDTIYAKSDIQIIDLFQTLVNAELLEIREYVYENNYYPKDDGDYIKSVTCRLTGENNTITSFKVPKIKKTLSSNELKTSIIDYIKIDNKKPKSIKITSRF